MLLRDPWGQRGHVSGQWEGGRGRDQETRRQSGDRSWRNAATRPKHTSRGGGAGGEDSGREERQASGSVKGERQVQPIRDEMELLESERRILSPGCCTEEREKKRKGGRKRRRDRTEDHMPHATLSSLSKRRMRRGGQERVWRGGGDSVVWTERNTTWDGGRVRWFSGRVEGQGGWWREKRQQHRLWTAPERRGGASPRHLLTDNSTNSSQIVRVCVGCVVSLYEGFSAFYLIDLFNLTFNFSSKPNPSREDELAPSIQSTHLYELTVWFTFTTLIILINNAFILTT